MRVFPQTYEQEAIWIAEQFAGRPSPFLETWAQLIRGPLDVPALERALAALVRRHPVLRTTFFLDDSGSVQRVDPDLTVPLERAAWPGGPPLDTLCEEGRRPLDLTRSPARFTLYAYGPDAHILLLQIHHIAIDDASLVLLDQDLSALYAQETGGEPAALSAPALLLGEHAVRTRAAGIAADDLDFWNAYLNGATPLTQLPPHARELPARRGTACGCVRTTVAPGVGAAVRGTARALRTTPHVLMSVCTAAVAAAAGGDEDIVLGTPVSRRGDPDLDDVFGCLTDLLPVRLTVTADATFDEACADAKRSMLRVLRHRQVPYAMLGGGATRTRGVLSGAHLGRISLVLDETPSRLELPGLHCERLYAGGAAAKFDWLQYVVADGQGWDVRADYACDYFSAEEAATVLAQWTRALTAVTKDPRIPVRALIQELSAV